MTTYTEQQIAVLNDAAEYLGFDEFEPNRATTTNDTLDDIDLAAKTTWAEYASRSEINCMGYQALMFEGAQTRKGEKRRDIIIVDLGSMRVTLN